ncbi:hypothetical protein [Leisingera sp. JC11]|uniref:hypothetical protein n=1 Tax=Leisingera sp. JC11 TaxID=3042469 RepID=UPI00345275BD
MIRMALLALALSAVGAAAQTAAPATGEEDCEEDRNRAARSQDSREECTGLLDLDDAAAAAEDEGITGFVPLVAPALGAAAAAAGVAAAAGGGSTPATTSTVSTN